jgi:predicted MFS family arabinose efflux permease
MLETAAEASEMSVQTFQDPRPSTGGNPVLQLFVVTTLLLVLTMAAAGFVTLGISQSYLLPQLDAKARAVGDSVAAKVASALHYGIPFERFVRMDEYLGDVLKREADISYIAVTDNKGAVIYHAGLDAARLGRLLGGRIDDKGAADEDDAGDSGLIAWLSRESLQLVGPPPIQQAARLGNFLDTALPLGDAGQTLGSLHVGVSRVFYRNQIREQMADIGVVLLVALLIAFEILLSVVTTSLTGPLQMLWEALRSGSDGLLVRMPRAGDTREISRLAASIDAIIEDQRKSFQGLMEKAERVRAKHPERKVQALVTSIIGEVRAVVRPPDGDETLAPSASAFVSARICAFLFVFAEEMARPFLPVYIQQVAENSGMGGSDFVVGLPLSVFMFVVAVAMPSITGWSETLGRRYTFGIGAALSTAGMLGMALTGNFWILVACRGISGFGYAMTFIACQGQVLDFAGPANRARGMAVFVGGITAADIAGPAIGGIIAGRVGFIAALVAGATLALVSGIAGWRVLDGAANLPRGLSTRAPRFRDMLLVTRNFRLMLLLLFSAAPAKLLLSGVLFFLVPLIAHDLGSTQSEVGRIIMAYGVASLALSPLFANLADRWGGHGVAVGAGGMIAGAGMIPMLFDPTPNTLTIAVICLGVGQSLSIAPQFALALLIGEPQIAKYGQGPVVGLYRLVERLGGAAGPFVAAGLVSWLGHMEAMAALGIAAVASALVFSVALLVLGVADEPDNWEDSLVTPNYQPEGDVSK